MGRKQQSHYLPHRQLVKPMKSSLLEVMEDGREFESLLNYSYENLNIKNEIIHSLQEIQSVRGNPLICYVANTVSSNLKADNSINSEDELPINELISSVPVNTSAADMIIVTPGGLRKRLIK